MATRDILPNWKECSSPQNMRKWQARKLTAVSVCPLRGQNTPLCSLVFMLCLFPKRHLKKNHEHLFQHFVFRKKMWFTCNNRCCDCENKMLLCITNSCNNKHTGQQCWFKWDRAARSCSILLLYLLTPVCRVAILFWGSQLSHLTILIHFNSWWPHK